MSFSFSQWRTMPGSAAIGMLLWTVGWIWFLAHYYLMTQDNTFTLRIAAALALLGYFLFNIRNWARMIALMANAMVMLLLAIWAFASLKSGESVAFAIEAINLVIFIAASYFLLVASTNRFFKIHGYSGGVNTDKS